MSQPGHRSSGLKCATFVSAALMSSLGFNGSVVLAQEIGSEGTIQINLPPQVEVGILLDLATDHLGMNLIYDEAVRGKQVTIRTNAQMTPEDLRIVVESALAMKDLVLVPTDADDWFRVASANDLVGLSAGLVDGEPLGGDQGDAPRTRVFRLVHAEPDSVKSLIEPFLSRPGGVVTAVPNTSVVLVTDVPRAITRAADLITLVDVADAARVRRFVSVEHGRASALSPRILSLVNSRPSNGRRDQEPSELQIVVDDPSNRLLLIGTEGLVQQAESLLAELDVEIETRTEIYALSSLAPERLERIAQATMPSRGSHVFESTIDPEGQSLIVEGTQSVHDHLKDLIERMDVPTQASQIPVRFYRLQNAKAEAVMTTIEALSESALNQIADARQGPQARMPFADPALESEGPQIQAVRLDLGGFQATVVQDEPTNSIIVIAPPSAQAIYGELIQQLDVRRPQVLIEVTIVTLDTSDGFSLGVELSRSTDTGEAGRVLTFSAFGLSQVDPATGVLSLGSAGAGFTGALLDGNVLDVVIRALQSDSRARVEAAPSILVNDNAEGSIESITEQPTTSINQGQNSDTVSFSDFVSAGTSISVTPTIAEGNHLSLDYNVELSAFDGDASGGVPAPRQTNTVSSSVTIPDGSTIILGGLNRRNVSDSIRSVPFLGDIPVVKELFTNRSEESSESTLFVFIRATILRDDQFRDLRAISGEQLEPAGLPDDFPASEAMWVD